MSLDSFPGLHIRKKYKQLLKIFVRPCTLQNSWKYTPNNSDDIIVLPLWKNVFYVQYALRLTWLVALTDWLLLYHYRRSGHDYKRQCHEMFYPNGYLLKIFYLGSLNRWNSFAKFFLLLKIFNYKAQNLHLHVVHDYIKFISR